MRAFFLVLARDEKHVDEKIKELDHLGMPYLIICGKRLNYPNVVYRAPRGKFDAINFGARLVPSDFEIVALNDVDTRIHNVAAGLKHFDSEAIGLVFSKVSVRKGPQKLFYVVLDFIRRRLLITASGELMFLRRKILMKALPIRPCKAEDTYILFKVLESKSRVVFSEQCFVETDRTTSAEKEELYKRKTVCGIYQALSYTRPPLPVRVFYSLLPVFSPILLLFGRKGYFWTKGILLGFADFLRGDRSGIWQTTYMD